MDTIPPTSLSDEMRDYYRALSAKGKPIMWQKKADGECMHLAPFGFKNARDESGHSVVVRDRDTYRFLVTARDMHSRGVSLRTIADALFQEGLKSKRGGKVNAMGIWRLLQQDNESK